MSAERKAFVCQLANAERDARAHPHVDINSPVELCQASQPEIFVVPVRYALAEEWTSHPCCDPGVVPQSHAMAARRLRCGYLYVWHHEGPLKRYAVADNGLLLEQALHDAPGRVANGTLVGLALDKHHDAWMSFTEHPIGPEQCARLSERKVRDRHMRHVDLRQVADTLQAPHCPPWEHADQVLAELLPESYLRALAIEHQRTEYAQHAEILGDQMIAAPTPASIKAYTDAMYHNQERAKAAEQYTEVSADTPPTGEWSAERWDALQVKDWLATIHAQARALYRVFACLDDELGVLRDINHEQEQVQTRHEQWTQDNTLRLSVGGFVRSLITEDAAEVAGRLRYVYHKSNDSGPGREIEFSTEQGDILLKAHQRLDELFKEEARINQQRGMAYSHRQADEKLRAVREQIAETTAPVRAFIPIDLYNEVETLVRQYRADKVTHLAKRAGARVEEYIDLPALNTWLDRTAPAHYAQVKERHTLLYADRDLYLRRHHRATWWVDYDDNGTRAWLDRLAIACLSAQCLHDKGAEQYADYVRSPDPGVLRQLFFAWSPTLEAALNSASRHSELLSALAQENRANAYEALAKVLAPLSRAVLDDIGARASTPHGEWNTLVKRLGAALLRLKGEEAMALSPAWNSLLVAIKLGSGAGVRWGMEGGKPVLRLFGDSAEALWRWAQSTGRAIGLGQPAGIFNSKVVQNSGGLIALMVLLLNSWNANSHLSQASALEGMDKQRINDTISATLYAGAALTAVVDMQIRKGLGVKEFNLRLSAAPTLTLFGAVIGGLSFYAAFKEFSSLQTQLENSRSSIDPWLDMRHAVVGAQVAVFGTQALLGVAYTARAIAGVMTVDAAIAGFSLWMGPVTILIAGLGVLYLIAWFFQQKPLQAFLANCCWSKRRARDLGPVSPEAQQQAFAQLYRILYAPKVSVEVLNTTVYSGDASGIRNISVIKRLTLDLPGAEPHSTYLALAMIGDPIDRDTWHEQLKRNPYSTAKPPRSWSDVGMYWLENSQCTWIPHQEGQGLRLRGDFSMSSGLSLPPANASLRVYYRTPLIALLGDGAFVGGERGVAFTITQDDGVITLRDDPTPDLDRARHYLLSDQQQCSSYLQPTWQK
uniref:toxin VasX n=1 Tax=Pseudomonas laurentiana TaxID=2364649 RepID=UPI0029C7A91D|nr:toxin VasX [Pseudomonas laurentiana]